MSEEYDLRSAQHEFAELAEKIAEKHGVFFSHLSFIWNERSTIEKTVKFISSVESNIITDYRG